MGTGRSASLFLSPSTLRAGSWHNFSLKKSSRRQLLVLKKGGRSSISGRPRPGLTATRRRLSILFSICFLTVAGSSNLLTVSACRTSCLGLRRPSLC